MRKSTVESMTAPEWEQARQTTSTATRRSASCGGSSTASKTATTDMNFTGPYLSTITARTLIVHGDRDDFFPVEIPLQMYRSIPSAALWIIPNGTHVPIYDPKSLSRPPLWTS